MDKIDRIVQENSDIWKTKANFYSFIKGLLRRGWMRHPVKIKLLNKRRVQMPNPKQKGKKIVWGIECEICHKMHVLSNVEVDHKLEESATLTKLEDIQSCAEKLLVVVEDDLRVLCKQCHGVVSLAASHGLTFEEAKTEKDVIAFGKLKSEKQKQRLTELGIDCTMYPTVAKRVSIYRDYLKENSSGN